MQALEMYADVLTGGPGGKRKDPVYSFVVE